MGIAPKVSEIHAQTAKQRSQNCTGQMVSLIHGMPSFVPGGCTCMPDPVGVPDISASWAKGLANMQYMGRIKLPELEYLKVPIELDEQRRRQEYEEKMEEEGRMRRMELEAKEAEQRARRNREKYDGQMQRIEQELKLEEAKLAQVRDQRVQAEQKLKQRYNYNQDYSVIHPSQKASEIHDVPDIPSPNLRSLHNTNNNNQTHNQPRYYFQENKIKSREPPQYRERNNNVNNNHDNDSGSVENILNDPSLQATLL